MVVNIDQMFFAIIVIIMNFLHQMLLISLFQPCRLFFLTSSESRLFSSVFFIDRLNKTVNGRMVLVV
uniref:Uncharacterized protein n=1 Tax=Anguilla anguilla TaxID=7936 RepID=A0A0E9WRH3_ANGAN